MPKAPEVTVEKKYGKMEYGSKKALPEEALSSSYHAVPTYEAP